MPVAISLHKVVKHYRRNRTLVEVLHGLDLEVDQGEFLALMGPSGSGKTTLLNLIGGLDSPSDGQVTVAGQHLEAMSGGELAKWRARHVGFVFQFYNLMPMLSAAANVELPLLLTHLRRAERHAHVAAALAMVGLADRATHKPGEMSGGQQQRVGLRGPSSPIPTFFYAMSPPGTSTANRRTKS